MYAGFHYKILPLRSGAWRFCSETSGYNLAYNKDMANTFATQFPSGRPKVDMRACGSLLGTDVCKGSYEVKEYRSEKRKEARAYLLFWLYGYNGKITKVT
ncbi:MAG: hypothetical protein ACLUVG_04535 [Phocaeicola vulgatus]